MSMFGERLRRLRESRGLSVSQLAGKVNVTDNAISQLELGNSKFPSFVVGIRIAKALGVSAEELAGERNESANCEVCGEVISEDYIAKVRHWQNAEQREKPVVACSALCNSKSKLRRFRSESIKSTSTLSFKQLAGRVTELEDALKNLLDNQLRLQLDIESQHTAKPKSRRVIGERREADL